MSRLLPAMLLAGLPALLRAGEPSFRDLIKEDVARQEAPAAAPGRPVWSVAKAGQVDLMPQFADASNRRQCDIGSCHAFSSIGVLEAAYYRQYGEKASFSEADIFIRRTVLGKDLYNEFCSGGKCKLSEGNDVAGDLKFALENGVASSVQYEGFVERYRRYREAEEKTLEGLVKQNEKESWLVRLLYDPRKHWAELQQRPESKRITEMLLAGRDPKIDKERAESKKKLGGFKLLVKEFPYMGSGAAKLPSSDCLKKGKDQSQAIRDEVKASRPVSVSMSLSGLKEWGQTDSSDHANHAFTIVGYRQDEKKGSVLSTRNSWGGNNPDVHEDELCRVYAVVTIRTPADSK